ncbi:MAG: cation diffusion facilitator family transporter, partial [Actinomycetota bacterium]|nr:cation diffusion facilitator family transporter [Actinomycetota bacterium]
RIPSRYRPGAGRGPMKLSAARPPEQRGAAMIRTKSGAAGLSVASNSLLIALKVAVGAITGSIAILTEAVHSLIDLLASVIALASVRKADEPADVEHPYGHEKLENLAAAIEGMLILVGAAVIVYEATHRLVVGAHVDTLGLGIAVMAVSALANFAISGFLGRQAKRFESPALEGDAAHLRTDAFTSIGVLVGLVLVEVTGESAFDSIAALAVAVAIVGSGLRIITRSSRVLVDEALPPDEMDRIEAAIAAARPPEVAGYHKLRARRAGNRRYVDLHVQFRSGTSLELAHELAHAMRAAIEAELPAADVLIHVEPEDSVLAPGESPGPFRVG